MAERLFSFQETRSGFAAEREIPVLGPLFCSVEILLVRRDAKPLALQRRVAVPVASSAFIDLDQASKDLMSSHFSLPCVHSSTKREPAKICASVVPARFCQKRRGSDLLAHCFS